MFAWEERALSRVYCWLLLIFVYTRILHATHACLPSAHNCLRCLYMFSSSFFSLKKFMLFVRSVRIGFSLVCSALFFPRLLFVNKYEKSTLDTALVVNDLLPIYLLLFHIHSFIHRAMVCASLTLMWIYISTIHIHSSYTHWENQKNWQRLKSATE